MAQPPVQLLGTGNRGLGWRSTAGLRTCRGSQRTRVGHTPPYTLGNVPSRLCCSATAGACLAYLPPQHWHMPVEMARRALATSLALDAATPHFVHGSIINGAPNGATVWFTTVCALSVALAALLYNLFSILASWQMATTQQEQRRHVLYGVDVTNSRFFKDPRVLEAVEFAAEAHAGQVRKTGEPYVSHCLETALIVEHNLPPAAEYERYTLAIIAALLHDVIDDTAVELSTIKARFGSQVALMVSQVSKLSQMNQLLRRGKRKGWAEYGPQHFKALRKMIVDMVFEEPLIILIKLADRLHNMRTVFVLKPEKQIAVAEETMEVWCTMAECLGWDALKSEIEDLCFAVLQPEQYCALRAQLDKIWSLPSLKVVVDQADSSSLPANALAPAPPFSVRGRQLAAASAARKAAAAAKAAVQALVPSAAGVAAHLPGAAAAAIAPRSGAATVALSEAPAAALGPATTTTHDDDSLNLGIRIVAVHRGSLDEEDVLHSATGGGAVVQGQGAGVSSASWDLVNWSMDQGTPEVRKVEPHTGVQPQSLASGRHTHPDVLLQAWAGTLPTSTVKEVTAATVAALVASDASSLQTAATNLPPAQDTTDSSAAHRQRLQSHAEAGPGPASSHSSSSSSSASWPWGGGSGGGGTATATATVTATSTATVVAAVGSRTATLPRPVPTKLLTADEIEQVLSGNTSSTSSAKAASVVAATPAKAASTVLPPVLFTAEQLAAERLQPVVGSSSSSTIAASASSSGKGTGSVLLPQQERLKSLLSTVVPFDSVNFKDTRALAMSTRRGLEVLDECAELLYSEVQLRSAGAGLSLRIQGRLKSLHSVYKKMVRKNCSVAEVYDARALRVIVGDEGGTRTRDSVEACYKLVSTVHSIWKPIPQEFDDYIANPKPSGYQALHTAVKGPGGIPMEVQIKTASMHELAEYGAAAHWVYKEYAHSAVMLPSFTPSPIPGPAGKAAQQPAAAAVQQPQGVVPPEAVPDFVPVQRLRGRGWRGQPVLRIAKDKLRYGVVVSAENEGRKLLVAVKSGPTSETYPIRIPDYGFYRSLYDYVQTKGWRVPGHSDFNLRLEEYVLANDGRFHRKDHMGYVLPAEVITLLEGYEEDADAADRAAYLAAREDADRADRAARADAADRAAYLAARAAGTTLPAVPTLPATTIQGTMTTAGAGESALAAAAPRDASGVFTSTAEGGGSVQGAADSSGGLSSSDDAGGAGPQQQADPAAERLRRQMQEAYLRTQQLRTMIEWGRAAMGRYHQGGSEPGDEVSVLVWPGGTIEHWPRGTTVAQLVRAKGIITLSGLPEPPEIRPSATAIAGGDDGWLYAREGLDMDSTDSLTGKRVALVNVNNRLVREDSVLNDGDLVILAREKVKI